MATLYVLHLDRPFKGRVRHYVGYTSRPLAKRLAEHGTGMGARVLQLARAEGIGWVVGYREWHADVADARARELRLKREKHLARHCETCQEEGTRCF